MSDVQLGAVLPHSLGNNAFRVSSELVAKSDSLRFDASFYNPDLMAALEVLANSGMRIVTLGEVAQRVFIPSRFKRNYVDADFGLPFLQSSHLVQFDPDIKFLSVKTHTDIDRWVIRAGWILVSCSGTIGRVVTAPPEWDGWAASQHILRVIPSDSEDCPVGYLATFLASHLGRVQLTAQIYGAVVDELTEEQARQVQVPLPVTRQQRSAVRDIHVLATQGVSQRSEGAALKRSATSSLNTLLGSETTSGRPRSFSLSSRRVVETPDLRLDASYFGEGVAKALSVLEATGMEMSTVGDLAERVFLPGRFKRHYVDEAHGVPFLRGANLVEFRPDDIMFLSNAIHENLESLTIHEGWILVTRSGTVGRVAVVSAEWEGWAATEDAIRIIASRRCDPHYLGTFLASPLGNIQLTRQVYGAVVDHLTEDHVRSVRVPLPKTSREREQVELVGRLAAESSRIRATAVETLDRGEDELLQLLGAPKTNAEFERFEIAMKTILSVPRRD